MSQIYSLAPPIFTKTQTTSVQKKGEELSPPERNHGDTVWMVIYPKYGQVCVHICILTCTYTLVLGGTGSKPPSALVNRTHILLHLPLPFFPSFHPPPPPSSHTSTSHSTHAHVLTASSILTVKSTTETSGTGTRNAMPVNFLK